MKPKYKTEIEINKIYRLRIDITKTHEIGDVLQFLEGLSTYIICCEEDGAGTVKRHIHCVFVSNTKITAIRTQFRRTFTEMCGSKYSFNQNWSSETKSANMSRYMNNHDLSYTDIHIIYILKEGNIIYNSLVENPEELSFSKILEEIKENPKNKKYGNFTKKLIMEYNLQYPEPLLESDDCCGNGYSDYPERERILNYVFQSFSRNNLDLFQSNAKYSDSYTIKKMAQTILNTRRYCKDFYPNQNRENVDSYYM